jgi:hypothetical protein
MKMRSARSVAVASLALLLLALAPSSAPASRTATSVRSRDFTYRDRTPRVHSGAPKQHHHKNK